MTTETDLRALGAITTEAGSPFANACVINQTTTAIDSNIFKLPYVKSSSVKDNTELKTVDDEGAIEHAISGGKRSATFELTFMQNDKGTKQFYETFRGKVLCVVKEEHTETINGKYQVRVAPYCKVVSSYDGSKPSIDTKIELKPQALPTALAIDLTAFDTDFCFTATCTALTLPAGTFFYLYEQ